MSPNIDFATIDLSNRTQIGVLGGLPLYIQSFAGNMPTEANTWGLFGNIGAGRTSLGAFGTFTRGNEQHFFPGGTRNSEMSAIYYNSDTGGVYATTIYDYPRGFPGRVTIIFM